MMLAAIDATPNSMIKPRFGSREFNCIIVRESGLIDVPNWVWSFIDRLSLERPIGRVACAEQVLAGKRLAPPVIHLVLQSCTQPSAFSCGTGNSACRAMASPNASSLAPPGWYIRWHKRPTSGELNALARKARQCRSEKGQPSWLAEPIG